MPTGALGLCPGACGRRSNGRCAECRTDVQRQRGSAHERGYGSAWNKFRQRFQSMLIIQGVAPLCGARLPDGPSISRSRCAAHGDRTVYSTDGKGLHYHHEPPLTQKERDAALRGDRSAFDDPRRIELLCARCHDAETKRTGEMPMFPPVASTRVVVTGPPGSGKSTWVNQHANEGDLVWDLDAMASTLAYKGRPLAQEEKGHLPSSVIEPLLLMRATLLNWMTGKRGVNAYIIVADPTIAQTIADTIGATVEHMARGGV